VTAITTPVNIPFPPNKKFINLLKKKLELHQWSHTRSQAQIEVVLVIQHPT